MTQINPSNVAENVNNVNNEANTATPAEPTVKKRRRGIGEVRGTSRLKFTEEDANRANGLFIAHLDSVELAWATQKEDSGLASFAGLAVPSLVFTFASNVEDPNKRKYATLRISPAESNALTIPGAKEAWKVEQPLNWLKHILDVYVLKGKPMSDEMADALELPFEDFNENMEYVPIDPEIVLNGWKTLFENFLNILNNGGKPYYLNASGKFIPVWIKLLRYTKVKGEWKAVLSGGQAGDLGFTSFVNEGCIEIFDNKCAPVLHVDPIKESIRPQQVAKAPTMPNIPGSINATGGVTPMGGAIPTPDYSQPANGIPTNAFIPNSTDDMPF